MSICDDDVRSRYLHSEHRLIVPEVLLGVFLMFCPTLEDERSRWSVTRLPPRALRGPTRLINETRGDRNDVATSSEQSQAEPRWWTSSLNFCTLRGGSNKRRSH